nr:class I SAM-dependent methyltransferase [uncultured Lachnoanaerobaculum sp.]
MINNKWTITEPKFESDLINPQLKFAYWEGHRDFVYDLINFVKPKLITELGSQYGCSLFTFCQSVKDNNLDTKIRAVDMWSGDIGAPDTGEEVFALVNKIKDTYFSNLDIKLYQMRFDDALPDFEDGSIDILHIDGGHTFEDVDHDLKTWLPKLSEDGIILFHDVYSDIDDGSCVHWRETKKKYSNFFDFEHSCGLGILFPKSDKWYNRIKESGFFELYKDVYFYRSKYKYVQNRFEELSGLYEERYKAIENQSEMIRERDDQIKGTEKLAIERLQAIENQSEMIRERDEKIVATEKLAVERLQAIENQSEMIRERDEKIVATEKLAVERLQAIDNQSEMIKARDERIEATEKLATERLKAIDEQSAMIADRDERIKFAENLAVERLEAINEQSDMIRERDEQIKILEDIATERLNTIKEKEDCIAVMETKMKEVEERQSELKKIIDNHIMSRWEYIKKFGGDI